MTKSAMHQSDFLVIGSGIAGLTFALKASQKGTVTVITKKGEADANTNYAQGGIAVAISPEDSFASHIDDTLTTGDGLCHREVVEAVVTSGPRLILELMEWGVNFSRAKDGERLDLGTEGGHSRRRVVHSSDLTGEEIERALVKAVLEEKRIEILEDHLALDLIVTSEKGKKVCQGVYVLDPKSGKIIPFISSHTFLATGGCGQIYLHTTNPDIATGDGIAMAYRAGVKVGNLEFVQFHPTSLYNSGKRAFLISEAVRGEGGKLRLSSGEEFMRKYHPLRELAPRDVVARAIDMELKKSGQPCVYLDVTHPPPGKVKDRFPHIYEKCLSLGLDMTKDWLPVVPAAHYMCGGVMTDGWGRTSIKGLYAFGEVACTGLHGANRLASNSLLEALAFADFSYQKATEELGKEKASDISIPPLEEPIGGEFRERGWRKISPYREQIKELMWRLVGIARSDKRLQMAKKEMERILADVESFCQANPTQAKSVELRNMALTAWLIIKCALQRKESRGLHYNEDYPDKAKENWRRDTVIEPED